MSTQSVFNFIAGSNVNVYQNTAAEETLQNPEKIGFSKRKTCS